MSSPCCSVRLTEHWLNMLGEMSKNSLREMFLLILLSPSSSLKEVAVYSSDVSFVLIDTCIFKNCIQLRKLPQKKEKKKKGQRWLFCFE